jgi:cell division protein FtsB
MIERIREQITKYSNYLFIIISILMLISLARNIIRVREAKERLVEKEVGIEKIRKENEELSLKVDIFKSDEYIELQLRNKLGLAKEEEIVIVLPDDETLRKFAPTGEIEEEILPDPNWKKWLNLFY